MGLLIQAAVGSGGGLGGAADEPLGVGVVGGVKDALTLGVDGFGVAVVDGDRGHQADA